MIADRESQDEGSVASGLAIGFILNVLVFIVLLFTILGAFSSSSADVFFWALSGIGLTQLLYMVPLYLYLRKTGRKDTAKGLVIIASITALANATCWGIASTRS